LLYRLLSWPTCSSVANANYFKEVKISGTYFNITEQSKQLFYSFLFSALMFKYVCIRHEKAIVTSHH
jgi:hypothetical protein